MSEKKPAGDEHMGVWIYCKSHLAVHRTGWCTVGLTHKIPLKATEASEKGCNEAYQEAKAMGLKFYLEIKEER